MVAWLVAIIHTRTGKTSWSPVTGEGLPLGRKDDNQHDEHLVAVINNGDVVHVPCSSLVFFPDAW